MCISLISYSAEVPGHRQQQLTQTLIVRLLKTHFSTHGSLTVKSQQDIIELVTRPGPHQSGHQGPLVHTVGQLLLERLQDCRSPVVKEWLLTAADALIYADKMTGSQLKTPFIRQLWAFTVNSVSLNHCVESANALLTTLIRYWSQSRGQSSEGIEHLEKLYALFTTKLVTPNEHTVRTLITLQVRHK